MSKQLQLRRDLASVIAAATGAQGEIFVDTTNNRLVLQDGLSAGGFPAAKLSETATMPRAVSAYSVNANSVADTPFLIILPAGYTTYRIKRVTPNNPSVSLTTAQAALYTGSGGSGVAICAPQALSALTTNAANTSGNAMDMTLALPAATFFTATTLYFRPTTPQGSTATVDVNIEIQPYS